jgi:hypothetical protein
MAFGQGEEDKLRRFSEPPVGWVAVLQIVLPSAVGSLVTNPERHYCGLRCLYNAIESATEKGEDL